MISERIFRCITVPSAFQLKSLFQSIGDYSVALVIIPSLVCNPRNIITHRVGSAQQGHVWKLKARFLFGGQEGGGGE